MSDLYNQIASQRGGFEKLLARIPGFRGYLEKATRRTADTMLREYLADLITQRLNRMIQVEKKLIEAGGLSYMARTQSARTKMQTYRDRVKAAPPGYSGFMEAQKINEPELERIYAFDEAQIRYADRLEEAITAFEQAVNANDGVSEAIDAIDQITIEANEAFTLRDTVLTDLSKTLGD